MFQRAFMLIAALWFMTFGTTHAQALLTPPYGLKWGDSPEKLISWASRHSLDVTISLPGDQPALRVVKIQARKGFLPGSMDSAVEGRFLSGRMFEITVHYSDPTASADSMEARFQQLKQKLTRDSGPLVADQQQRATADQFTTRTQSFHREPVKGLFLMLAYTEVEDQLRKSKDARYSVIYRNDNLRQEIEKLLLSPAVPPDGR
ncbi:hypothetical protein KBB96_04555 [Luteolibacter ambystomatis]|uniref:Uncharacterized protein n=1 Tax=Luteolibacter ambystomatis TaxID=2824561 RepID=A0A975PFY4_9BACT|nr:hypothetical protein [Luteolibacter ambystomatis]QUE52165.1 hypothetical protein KBB96_04555 [Luteolibacter ambystomatis]